MDESHGKTMQGSQTSPNGRIVVRTTERGLPLAIKLDRRELLKPPTQLAEEVLLLCQLSAARMQVARRRDLVARGFSPAVIRSLDLSTEQELADVHTRFHDRDLDDPPHTWMNRI